MAIDAGVVQIFVALLTGGVGLKLVDLAVDRWKQASGRRRTHAQEVAEWRELVGRYREALARARYLAVKAGVSPDDLPTVDLVDPED